MRPLPALSAVLTAAALAGCDGGDQTGAAALTETFAAEGFTLQIPDDAQVVSRAGPQLREYRVVHPEVGTLAEVTVSPVGRRPPMLEGETMRGEAAGNPREVSTLEADGERHVVGYVWRRDCPEPMEISAWVGVGFVSSTPDDAEHGARRALSEAVASSLRPTPCGGP